jgi:hypothetical protein
MTQPTPRTLVCRKCGVTFGCSLEGGCWCNDESFRLPLPTDGSDCLCPDCLRRLAQQQQQQQQ